MGYWQIGRHPQTGEALVSGDTPADIFSGAVHDYVKAFTKDIGRAPYREELAAALSFVLDGYFDPKTEEDGSHYGDIKPAGADIENVGLPWHILFGEDEG